MDGILNVNKPEGPTSFDMVRSFRKALNIKKAGHAGTLDPAASGVLLMLAGEACKAAPLFLNTDKTYRVTLKLGWQSDTMDSTGNITRRKSSAPDPARINGVLAEFRGEYIHRVPSLSAKKHRGRTFYNLKRKGIEPPERLQYSVIHRIDMEPSASSDKIVFSVSCSSGTYIRTLAGDILDRLGVSGYMSRLERTRVCCYKIENAVEIDCLEADWREKFIPIPDALARMEHIVIDREASEGLRYGRQFTEKNIIRVEGDIDGKLFGVLTYRMKAGGLASKTVGGYRLKRVFASC